MGNHHLANSIASAAWREFRRQMEYKAADRGKNVLFIGRFEPSSRLCHVCGHRNDGLALGDRTWTCPGCGTVLDRDVNAAVNIRNMAFEKRNVMGVPDKIKHPSGSGGGDVETPGYGVGEASR